MNLTCCKAPALISVLLLLFFAARHLHASLLSSRVWLGTSFSEVIRLSCLSRWECQGKLIGNHLIIIWVKRLKMNKYMNSQA